MKFLKKHLVLKEKRVGGRTRTLTIFSYLGLSLLVVGSVLGYLWVRMQVLKTGYEIVNLREQHDRLSNLNKSLAIHLMNFTSLKHVDEKARAMNFSVPTKDRVVFVEMEMEDKRFFLENLKKYLPAWLRISEIQTPPKKES